VALLDWLSSPRRTAGLLAVGIDADAVRFAHVQRSGGSRPVATHWSSVASALSEQADAIQRTVKEQGFGRCLRTTLLEPAEYQILLVEPPKVPADELKAAIRWKIKDLLEYHVDDATVDVFEVRSEGDAAAKAMYAVATPNQVVQKRIELFEQARVPLRVIDIPEMAQRNVATLFESPDKATAMLAFSSWGGLLTVSFRGELLLTRRLEVTAVQLGQREHGDHYRERVATEITRSLDIFERQRLSVAVGELLLAPLPQDPELERFLQAKLYVPVTSADLPRVMDFAGGGEPTLQDQWEYFHLFGAAMRVEEKAL
jgi:MSHA biogenesis protein MshI